MWVYVILGERGVKCKKRTAPWWGENNFNKLKPFGKFDSQCKSLKVFENLIKPLTTLYPKRCKDVVNADVRKVAAIKTELKELTFALVRWAAEPLAPQIWSLVVLS